MLGKLFPPKWRLRVLVIETLFLAASLMAFAKTFDKMTTPQPKPAAISGEIAQDSGALPSRAELQSQLAQMAVEKYAKDGGLANIIGDNGQEFTQEQVNEMFAAYSATIAKNPANTAPSQ